MRAMSIGGKTFWVLPTPGHTPGATSAVLEVTDWGKTRRVLINGGQSMTNSIPEVAQYLDSIERAYAMAKALNVDGVMTPHIYWDGEGEKLDEINATGRTNPSQNIYGHEIVMRMTRGRARVLRGLAHAPRYDRRSSRVAFQHPRIRGRNPTPTKVAAKLTNGWGPAANQKVTFSVGTRTVRRAQRRPMPRASRPVPSTRFVRTRTSSPRRSRVHKTRVSWICRPRPRRRFAATGIARTSRRCHIRRCVWCTP